MTPLFTAGSSCFTISYFKANGIANIHRSFILTCHEPSVAQAHAGLNTGLTVNTCNDDAIAERVGNMPLANLSYLYPHAKIRCKC